MVLLVEQKKEESTRKFRESCKAKKKKLMLSLLPMDELAKIYIIYPTALQYYHSFDFHQIHRTK